MPVFVVGLSHHTSPLELRERFAFPETAIPAVLERLRAAGLAEEGVILSTCNRVELYLAASQVDDAHLDGVRRFLLDHAGQENGPGDWVYVHGEPRSIEHLFRVACGLDSMVLGETEILGQLKRAYDLALRHKHTGGRLNKAFQRAFNVAKHIRTETAIQRGSISVASVAVELAEKIFDDLSHRTVLIIGAGDTSEKTARAFVSRGTPHLVVTNRTFERAEALAAELKGRAVRFHEWAEIFNSVDVVISSTAAQDYVLERSRLEPLLKTRRYRPLLLVDLAVPRDIDPGVGFLENVFLYNVDDLQSIANDYLRQRREEIARCEVIIRERTASLLTEGRRVVCSPAVPAQFDPEPGNA
jgi:glutamyl-tRNA reductase